MYLDVTTCPDVRDIRLVRKGLIAFNLSRVPELAELPDDEYLVIMRENGRIIGGAVCSFDWGWLYFDTVWSDPSMRGKGYGTLIMNAAESYAAERGIRSAFLMTTSFQARPFYEKLGYRWFGTQANRPRGHEFYYLYKPELHIVPADPRVIIEAPPSHANTLTLENGLIADINRVAHLDEDRIGIFLRDDAGTIRGGLVGGLYWNWLDMRLLWVDEGLRGHGWGRKLIEAAEAEARAAGFVGICCDTASFQALPFYQSLGFTVIGKLNDRPPSHASYFLQKRL